MKIRPVHIFSFLCLSFIVYSFSIYLIPSFGNCPKTETSEATAQGRLVWQKYNCQSCHQLYGLGGYLGPDLTNVYSANGKGDVFIKALIRSGTKQMPSFELSPQEEINLLEFLKSTDASGVADPRQFHIHPSGMIEAK